MITHSTYSTVEKELKEKHPEIVRLLETGSPEPASLSPLIIKGLLRKDLGYNGLVIADWYDMGSIANFIENNRKNFQDELKSFDSRTLTIILACYAGINWITGINTRKESSELRKIAEEDTSPEGIRKQVKQFYDKNIVFRKLFDDLVLESLLLKLQAIPVEQRLQFNVDIHDITIGDLGGNSQILPADKSKKIELLKKVFEAKDEQTSFDIKLDVLTLGWNHEGALKESPQALKVIGDYYSRWTDIWNRGGLLDVEFRKNIIEELTGIHFEGLEAPTNRRQGNQWMVNLLSNKKFREKYYGLDWNGVEMQSVFAEYDRRKQQKTDFFAAR